MTLPFPFVFGYNGGVNRLAAGLPRDGEGTSGSHFLFTPLILGASLVKGNNKSKGDSA